MWWNYFVPASIIEGCESGSDIFHDRVFPRFTHLDCYMYDSSSYMYNKYLTIMRTLAIIKTYKLVVSERGLMQGRKMTILDENSYQSLNLFPSHDEKYQENDRMQSNWVMWNSTNFRIRHTGVQCIHVHLHVLSFNF